MFNAVVILASTESAPLIRSLIATTGQVTVMRELPAPPGDYELARLMNTLVPDLVFVDLGGGQESLECVARVRELAPRTPVIGLGCGPEVKLLARRLGAAWLAAPDCTPDSLRVAIRETMEAHHGGVEPHLYSFLPAKAGSGCSTVVMHTAIAAARLGKRVLVVDADLRSSVLGLMLGVTPVGGTQAVLEAASELDQFVMRRNVIERHGVDFLLSTRALDAELPDWTHYFRLLNFVRSSYELILVDLPELINPATVHVVRRSKKTFPVCTSELPSLKLALQRLEELGRLGLEAERVGVVVNRVGKDTPKVTELEEVLGRQVSSVIPNNYRAISHSIAEATALEPESELARAFAVFAAALAGVGYKNPAPSLRAKLKGLLHPASA